jgi:ribonucleoside-diphosphate reductase alpha chain
MTDTSPFKSSSNPQFRSQWSEKIFNDKYAHDGCETWEALCNVLAQDVCGPFKEAFGEDGLSQLTQYMTDMKFIPGGRYLYYAGREAKYFNNCYLLKAEEDTREDWANLSWKAESCLLTGGGIGADYSKYREKGRVVARTGGVASGPIPKMHMVDNLGRGCMQGGTRRAAIYASLNHTHPDINEFLYAKDWYRMPIPGTQVTYGEVKQSDFNFPAPLDHTNISVNYDTAWLLQYYRQSSSSDKPYGDTFHANVEQALRTGEPGFSFNFFEQEDETLRNACTEVTSSDDSDVCNLGSINLSRIDNITEMKDVVELATKFLLCGTLRADLPYEKVWGVRQKNRRLGLGLMGVHEWLLQRDYDYSVTPELHRWLSIYKGQSNATSKEFADRLDISRPVANRAIAPTGTIGIVAGTTTGIEPVFAVAYKRRYLVDGHKWRYQYAIDHASHAIIQETGIDPEKIESARDLAKDYTKRIKFQADVQDYVDMSISSTINMPAYPKDGHSKEYVRKFATTLASYAPRLRGFTVYPDGSRGGQPLTTVPYSTALAKIGEEFEENIQANDICEITGGGTCGS